MTTHKPLLLVPGLLAALGGVASANAFLVNEHDAKVSGRGGTAVASDTDASSVIFNPGGIPVAEGVQVSINGSMYVAQGKYSPLGGGAETETDSDPSYVPSMYATARLNDWLAIGVGFHLPFGLALSWPDKHVQQTTIQDQALRTYFITAALGINLNKVVPGLSIGGGVDIVPSTVKLERAVVFGETQGSVVLGGDAIGYGGRAGVLYRPPAVKQLSLGVMWRSQIKEDYEGTGDFDIDQPYRDQLPPDGDVSLSITFPQSVVAGIEVTPTPRLSMELNAQWVNWEKFKELRIRLPDGTDSVAPENYENTTTVRFGAEFRPTWKSALRAGFIYDPTPIPSESLTAQLPDADRLNVTVGGSYQFSPEIGAHLSLLWVTPQRKDTSDKVYEPAYKGTYEVQALVTSLSISGTFGGSPHREPAPQPDPAVTAQR